MTASVGPRIEKDGLVFAYDVNNQKSNKGKPTTNLIQPVNDGNNTTHPSYRPYSGSPHFGGGTVTTTEVPPPHPGLTVYKHTDDGVDSQTGRLSIRYLITQGLLSYDTTYCHSYYVWLPSEYAARWGNGQRGGLYQNTAGGDWHSWRGYNATYSNYGAGGIQGTSLVGGSPSGPWGQMYDKTKLDQWQRVYAVFTPLTDNINVPGEGDLDNNINATGWYRYLVSNGVSGGDPFHIYTSGGMLEEGVTSPAPWAYTERTVDDAVTDLTGTTTVDTNATYDSTGTELEFVAGNINRMVVNGSVDSLCANPDTYSLECVFMKTGNTDIYTQGIIFGWQGYNNGIIISDTNQVYCGAWYANSPWSVRNTALTAVSENQWYHAVMTFNANGNITFYINGSLETQLILQQIPRQVAIIGTAARLISQ